MSKSCNVILLFTISIAAITGIFLLPPIAQDLAYHAFADKRGWFGIPNFGNVVGNAPFILFGLMGLHYIRSAPERNFTLHGERALWLVFFAGAALVGFGSAYYHLNPNNATLVWDRLPMTISFMSFFALIIMERIDEKAGLLLSLPLLLLGSFSVFYWDYSEALGRGDLRLYVLVQFLPILLIPLIFWRFPARYSGLKYLGYTLGWYMLAKLFEHFDKLIFAMTSELISGHTIKHIAASMAVYTVLLYVKKRDRLAV